MKRSKTSAAPAGTVLAAGPPAESGSLLLEIRGLTVEYGTDTGAVRAVDSVDLDIRRGCALGIAGESGSGKSTLAHAITRLLRPPASVAAGQVRYWPRTQPGTGGGPVDILALNREALRRFRWQQIAIVFQSAMNALNPVIDVRSQLLDTLEAHGRKLSRTDMAARAAELLRVVGVSPDRARAYPHQLSGGMRQRVMIAMALALEPELLVMDEPTTALDVVTQRQILEQVLELRRKFGFSLLFITHDLSLLLEIADEIAVMYAGRVVERAPARRIYASPAHPYSAALLRSFPPLTGPLRELTGIPGSPPDLRNLPSGCSFAPRCGQRMEICERSDPALIRPPDLAEHDQLVACWLHPATAPAGRPGASGHAAHSTGGAAHDR